jgi:predicted AAA+ superfamily ATPase
MNQRKALSERLEKGLGSHQVQILQGCLGVGKTFFLTAWGKDFARSHPEWNLRFFTIKENDEKAAESIFEAAISEEQLGKPTLYLIDNIDKIRNFSAFVNSMNSLPNVSCVATADVDIRISKKAERTLFADRCVFFNFVPLSYVDCLELIDPKAKQKKTVVSYLFTGGIPSVILSANPKKSAQDFRKRILLFVQRTFRLDDPVLLAHLFDSFCRFAGFPKNEFGRELSKDELKFSHNTLLKYTRALSACFAISELPRINADNFTRLNNAPAYLPLDSCFDPSALSYDLRLIDAAEIALYNRLIADGCILGVSIVNRQPYKDGRYRFEQIENGFLVSRDSRIWFVAFSWDDGASGKKAMKELRNSFPKIIVVLPDIPNQLTNEGFFLVSLSSFLQNGLEVIKGII